MNDTESAALGDQVRESKQYCMSKFPACRYTRVCWSNQLTSSVGNARKGSPNVIKLSAPIVRAVLEDRGLEEARRVVDETVKHEFAHIAVKFSDAPSHGQEWAANMHTLGLSPERYHHCKCGRELFSDGTLRAKFTRGTEVLFQYKDTWYRGRVRSHKVRKVHVRVEARLSITGQWEPVTQFTFTCPWSIAEKEMLLVQKPKAD